MNKALPSAKRVSIDGKYFRCGEKKFYVKGVTYGPFAPNEKGEYFASRLQTDFDLRQLRELGANLLRVYYVPPVWFLDAAAEQGLKVFVDVPWPKHLCFLDSMKSQREARQMVRAAVRDCQKHPAVFAFSVVNEIPAEIVRWSGRGRAEKFIDQLVEEGKELDPECLFTFTSFPPTEFLQPQHVDFVCFNVYLHHRGSYEKYLDRLQMLANTKPIMLGEFGLDSFREGETHKCEVLSWQIESAFRAGLAGTIIFSYTDDWFRGGHQIEDWAFGLTTRDRQPKNSFGMVQKQFTTAPHFPLRRYPKVSIVVASYNGARTLRGCLDSLARLNYPDYEVILVDDGSTDATREIAGRYLGIRYIHHANRGLSAARNTGINAATGEIVAFTDSDCRADEDWLMYLVGDLLNTDFVGIGGHNFLPPEDGNVSGAVMASPGGPAHVMLTDREAEHIPGCNMAFYKWALDEIGGFDPVFTKAGDDVDVCWRLQENNHKIGFSSSGFVWHHRRATVKAYLKQQAGYGEAEAMLARKHPKYFNSMGGSIWRGKIYSAGSCGVRMHRSVIYHGLFGSGFFQKLYNPAPSFALMYFTSIEFYSFVVAPLFALSLYFESLLPCAAIGFLFSLVLCGVAAFQAALDPSKRKWWSRPLIVLLFFLQPIVRGWARWRYLLNQAGRAPAKTLQQIIRVPDASKWSELQQRYYWCKGDVDRYGFLSKIMERLRQSNWFHNPDTGWTDHDIEIVGNRWSELRLTTVSEELAEGRRNFRCRLAAFWTAPAKVIFGSLCVLEFAVIHFTAPMYPFIWFVLLTLPVFGWFMEEERRKLQYSIAVILDEVAVQQQMVILEKNLPADGQT